MYQIIELNDDNISSYETYLGYDVSENLDRTYYRGLVAQNEDDVTVAAIVYVLKNLDSGSKDTLSNIVWARCDDTEAFGALMEKYTDCVKALGVKTSKVTLPAKNGKELRALFRNAGFEMGIDESDIVTVRVSELSAMPFMQKLKKVKLPDSIMVLNEITMRPFKRALAKCVSRGIYGLCDDLEELPVAYFEDDVSCISVSKGEINGLFLFHKRPSGVMAIQLLICLDSSFKTTIPHMMRRFVTAMEEKYGPDALVELDRHNEQSLLLSEKLLPRGLGMPIYSGDRSEV